MSDGHVCTDDGRPISTFSARRGPSPPPACSPACCSIPAWSPHPCPPWCAHRSSRTRHPLRAGAQPARGHALLIEIARRAVPVPRRRHVRLPLASRQHNLAHATQRGAPSTSNCRPRARRPVLCRLPEPVRERFLHAVLTEALADRIDAQARLIDSSRRSPPVGRRAGAAPPLDGERAPSSLDAVETADLIRQARRLAPRDPVAQALAALLAIHPRLARPRGAYAAAANARRMIRSGATQRRLRRVPPRRRRRRDLAGSRRAIAPRVLAVILNWNSGADTIAPRGGATQHVSGAAHAGRRQWLRRRFDRADPRPLPAVRLLALGANHG